MRFTGFIGPSYTQRSVNVDCQRCINLYPELDELGTGKEREVAALVSTPGLSLLVNIGTGPIRGNYVSSTGQLFVVSGNQLYSVSSSWVATSLGTLQTSAGPVIMNDTGTNNGQLVLVDGSNGYLYNFNGGAFAQITDPNFNGANMVITQDTYMIFNAPGSNQFYFTNPYAGGFPTVSFNGLNYATKETYPEPIVGIVSDHRNLWLFGSNSIEVWYDQGGNASLGGANPWQPIQGGFSEVGCAAPYSIQKMNNTIIWLGRDSRGQGVVYMAQGYQPVRISTHAVEQALQSYNPNTIGLATSYTYQEDGHSFYVLNFPTYDFNGNLTTTWVFDSTTNLWHERAYNNNGLLQRHRADNHSFAYGVHVVGDYANGNLYQQNLAVNSDNSNPISRVRSAPHITSDLSRIFYNSFQLDIESGVGLDGIQQGTNPQVVLTFSDDGGHTWSNEKWASMGKIGQTKWRALWRRLGQSRDRVFKVVITDPVRVTLIGADLDVEKGMN
jgi:hypothetical protein